MRTRCISASEIRPEASVDGTFVLEADRRHRIDNMESVCVHQTGSGEIAITPVSDDNFSPSQRTLRLQFFLMET